MIRSRLLLRLEGPKTGALDRNTADFVSNGPAIDHGKLDNTADEGNPRPRSQGR